MYRFVIKKGVFIINKRTWYLLIISLSVIILLVSCVPNQNAYPPTKPTLSSPNNLSLNVSIPVTLKWEPSTIESGGILAYEVYLDAYNPPQTKINTELILKTELEVKTLQPDTQYFWEVVAVSSTARATSDIFSFKTADSGGVTPPSTSGIFEDFESGTFSSKWNLTSNDKPGFIRPILSQEGRNGGYAARFNPSNNARNSRLETTINITTDKTISFYSFVPGGSYRDFFTFEVYSTTNMDKPIKSAGWFNRPSWEKHEVALPAGTYNLVWRAYTVGAYSYALLDDIELKDSAASNEPTYPNAFNLSSPDNEANLTDTNVTLQWNNTNAGEYLVFVNKIELSSTDTIPIPVVNENGQVYHTTSTTINLKLDPNFKYDWFVIAFNQSNGGSTLSEVRSFKIQGEEMTIDGYTKSQVEAALNTSPNDPKLNAISALFDLYNFNYLKLITDLKTLEFNDLSTLKTEINNLRDILNTYNQFDILTDKINKAYDTSVLVNLTPTNYAEFLTRIYSFDPTSPSYDEVLQNAINKKPTGGYKLSYRDITTAKMFMDTLNILRKSPSIKALYELMINLATFGKNIGEAAKEGPQNVIDALKASDIFNNNFKTILDNIQITSDMTSEDFFGQIIDQLTSLVSIKSILAEGKVALPAMDDIIGYFGVMMETFENANDFEGSLSKDYADIMDVFLNMEEVTIPTDQLHFKPRFDEAQASLETFRNNTEFSNFEINSIDVLSSTTKYIDIFNTIKDSLKNKTNIDMNLIKDEIIENPFFGTQVTFEFEMNTTLYINDLAANGFDLYDLNLSINKTEFTEFIKSISNKASATEYFNVNSIDDLANKFKTISSNIDYLQPKLALSIENMNLFDFDFSINNFGSISIEDFKEIVGLADITGNYKPVDDAQFSFDSTNNSLQFSWDTNITDTTNLEYGLHIYAEELEAQTDYLGKYNFYYNKESITSPYDLPKEVIAQLIPREYEWQVSTTNTASNTKQYGKENFFVVDSNTFTNGTFSSTPSYISNDEYLLEYELVAPNITDVEYLILIKEEGVPFFEDFYVRSSISESYHLKNNKKYQYKIIAFENPTGSYWDKTLNYSSIYVSPTMEFTTDFTQQTSVVDKSSLAISLERYFDDTYSLTFDIRVLDKDEILTIEAYKDEEYLGDLEWSWDNSDGSCEYSLYLASNDQNNKLNYPMSEISNTYYQIIITYNDLTNDILYINSQSFIEIVVPQEGNIVSGEVDVQWLGGSSESNSFEIIINSIDEYGNPHYVDSLWNYLEADNSITIPATYFLESGQYRLNLNVYDDTSKNKFSDEVNIIYDNTPILTAINEGFETFTDSYGVYAFDPEKWIIGPQNEPYYTQPFIDTVVSNTGNNSAGFDVQPEYSSIFFTKLKLTDSGYIRFYIKTSMQDKFNGRLMFSAIKESDWNNGDYTPYKIGVWTGQKDWSEYGFNLEPNTYVITFGVENEESSLSSAQSWIDDIVADVGSYQNENTPPTPPVLTAPVSGTSTTSPVTFEWTASTDTESATVGYMLEIDYIYTDYIEPYMKIPLTDTEVTLAIDTGDYIWYVIAYDEDGGVSFSEKNILTVQ